MGKGRGRYKRSNNWHYLLLYMCVHIGVSDCMFMSVCVCAHTHARPSTHSYVGTCVESRGHPEVSLSGMLSTSFETGSITGLELSKCTILASQQAQDLFVSLSPMLGLQRHATTHGFLTWVLGLQCRSVCFTH